MDKHAKIYVAGHRGLVGAAIVRKLQHLHYEHLITRSKAELDLRNQQAVADFFVNERPDYVILAAAKVGGIHANHTYPADFIYDNLMIQMNVIQSAYMAGVTKLLFLGSSCIYPKNAPQPMKEEYLLTGELEPTNEPYAIAKIAGIKMCEAYNRQFQTHFVSVMPTNLYGIHDNFDLESSHVLPALIRKFHEAKLGHLPYVTVWGSGKPLREFLYVEDLAEACIFLMHRDDFDALNMLNIGTGSDVSIIEFAQLIKSIVGYTGEIRFDPEKPDGTPRKLLDVSKIEKLGWKSKVSLEEGIKQTYAWYVNQSSAGCEL